MQLQKLNYNDLSVLYIYCTTNTLQFQAIQLFEIGKFRKIKDKNFLNSHTNAHF